MALRNAPSMLARVRHGEKPNLSQHHNDNERLSAGPPLLTDGVHSDASDVHLGKREAGTYNGQESRIQTKQTRHIHPKDTLPLSANDEKKTKQEVIRALNGVSKSDSMISMATSILNWSTRPMRNEIYTYYYIQCHKYSLDPLSFANWFLSKIEEYNSSIHERDHDTSANVQAPLAHSKDAAEDFLKWLKIPSRTLNDPDTATNTIAATSEKLVAAAVAVSQVGRGALEAGQGGSHARPDRTTAAIWAPAAPADRSSGDQTTTAAGTTTAADAAAAAAGGDCGGGGGGGGGGGAYEASSCHGGQSGDGGTDDKEAGPRHVRRCARLRLLR